MITAIAQPKQEGLAPHFAAYGNLLKLDINDSYIHIIISGFGRCQMIDFVNTFTRFFPEYTCCRRISMNSSRVLNVHMTISHPKTQD